MENISEQEAMKMQLEAERNPNQIMYDNAVEEKVVNIISQLNPDNLLSDIEHRLRGYKKDYFSGEWKKLKGHKEVPEKLVSKFISFLGGVLNDNTRFSNYSAREINNIMEQVIDFIKDDLTDNDEEYKLARSIESKEIREMEVVIDREDGTSIIKKVKLETVTSVDYTGADYDEMNRIGHIICINVFSVLKRALNGSESRRIFGALKVTESLNQNEKGKGVFDAVQFWK